MAIEIADLPINSMVIFHSYISLPEGNPCRAHKNCIHNICIYIYIALRIIVLGYVFALL